MVIATVQRPSSYTGDISSVVLGDDVTVGEKTVISCSNILKRSPTKVGNKVLIGAGVSMDSCTIADECSIGDGAHIHEGATMEKQAMLTAGSILPYGKVVPAGQVWSGAPAKYVRNILPAEIEANEKLVRDNRKLATAHATESNKGWLEIEEDEFNYEQTVFRSEYYYKRLTPQVSSLS